MSQGLVDITSESTMMAMAGSLFSVFGLGQGPLLKAPLPRITTSGITLLAGPGRIFAPGSPSGGAASGRGELHRASHVGRASRTNAQPNPIGSKNVHAEQSFLNTRGNTSGHCVVSREEMN